MLGWKYQPIFATNARTTYRLIGVTEFDVLNHDDWWRDQARIGEVELLHLKIYQKSLQ